MPVELPQIYPEHYDFMPHDHIVSKNGNFACLVLDKMSWKDEPSYILSLLPKSEGMSYLDALFINKHTNKEFSEQYKTTTLIVQLTDAWYFTKLLKIDKYK